MLQSSTSAKHSKLSGLPSPSELSTISRMPKPLKHSLKLLKCQSSAVSGWHIFEHTYPGRSQLKHLPMWYQAADTALAA